MTDFTKPMIFMSGKVVFFLILLLLPGTAFSETFKWVDKNGETHFTDDYLKIPREYRDRIKKRKGSPTSVIKPEPAVIKEKSIEPVKMEEADPMGKEVPQEGKKKITMLKKITSTVDEKGNAVFSGKIRNNSKELFSSMEIVFTLQDHDGKIFKKTSFTVSGKTTGVLKGGETGSFEARTGAPINSIGSYKYVVNWKNFGQ